KGDDFLNSVLDTDEGARYLGEFAIGTNTGIQKFTRNILFDEKIGGTVHMAVGAGSPGHGAENEAAVQWDMIGDTRCGGQVSGTVHMAVGAGYRDTGSKNESAVHWDMICDMRSGGEIIVDGELFYKDGEFQV